MSTPEEFEVALAKAQAAIAGLRAAPPPVHAAAPSTSSEPVVQAMATPARAASAMSTPTQPEAGAAPPRAIPTYLKAALIMVCIAVAFLQYYYIEISLQISSLPALFTRR
jgi:hypothetical protein